jgi:phage terminase large subunit
MGAAVQHITFDATWICGVTLEALRQGTRYVWHEGGSRASKTYNIAAAVLLYAAETGAHVDVVRLTNPDLKGSVLRDLLEVAEALGLYAPELHHKTDQTFTLKGGRGVVRYFGIEHEQKVRGWKRDVLWMNEANEIDDEKRRQLWMRTARTIVIDHNPTVDDDHWIVSKLEPRVASGECRRFHSTYRDNPFLEAAIVREIEAMQYDDPWGWTVYGRGLRGSNPGAVFTDVSLGAFTPQKDTVYGVDFGMKDPFVVCEWGWRDANPPAEKRATLYCRPWLYASNLTTGEAIRLLEERGAPRDKPMYCDSAEPDRIRELQQAGYQAVAVEKRQGAREAGFDWMKRHRIVVDHEAAEAEAVKNELRRTRHKKKPGADKFTDEVVDRDDHVADSGRYGAFSAWGAGRTLTGVVGSVRVGQPPGARTGNRRPATIPPRPGGRRR